MADVTRTKQDLLDFVDTAAVGLHWVAQDGTILWANPADYEPLGYVESEYVGLNIVEFHADDATIQDILGRLTAGQRLHNYEARLKCKDGSTRKVLVTSSVKFSETGEFVHTRCFTVDVSSQRPEGVDIQIEALNREVERLSVLASRERGPVLVVDDELDARTLLAAFSKDTVRKSPRQAQRAKPSTRSSAAPRTSWSATSAFQVRTAIASCARYEA